MLLCTPQTSMHMHVNRKSKHLKISLMVHLLYLKYFMYYVCMYIYSIYVCVCVCVCVKTVER